MQWFTNHRMVFLSQGTAPRWEGSQWVSFPHEAPRCRSCFTGAPSFPPPHLLWLEAEAGGEQTQSSFLCGGCVVGELPPIASALVLSRDHAQLQGRLIRSLLRNWAQTALCWEEGSVTKGRKWEQVQSLVLAAALSPLPQSIPTWTPLSPF